MMAATAVQPPMPPSPNSNKRKRGATEQDNVRELKMQHTHGQENNSDYTFLQAMQETMQSSEGSAQTAQAALAAPMVHSQYPDSFDASTQLPSFDDGTGTPNNASDSMGSTVRAYMDARQQHNAQKPSIGSDAWHRQRRENHKEVERRRREVINEGIENIAKIVPGSEKNKGAILARTCSYIAELNAKVDAFENERRVFDSTLSELTNRHDTMKRAWLETQKWQQRCRDAGLLFDDYTIGGGNDQDVINGVGATVDAFDGVANPDVTSADI